MKETQRKAMRFEYCLQNNYLYTFSALIAHFLHCQPSRTERNLKMWIVSEELGAHNGDLIVEFESDAACPSDSPIGLWSHNMDPRSDWKQDTSITVKCNDNCFDRPMCVQFSDQGDNACMDLMVRNQCPILCGTCQPF